MTLLQYLKNSVTGFEKSGLPHIILNNYLEILILIIWRIVAISGRKTDVCK